MSGKDAHLYGIPRIGKTTSKNKPITSTTSLSFKTALSSLISASSAPSAATTFDAAHTTGRARPSRTKTDIFTSHNRNSHKRAAADMLAPSPASHMQIHTTSTAPLDDAAWRQAKRKMEDKARLYSAMKRGDIDDDDGRALIDFDRKWADAGGENAELSAQSDSDDDGASDGVASVVEYEDEFGRTRHGTRLDAAREAARRKRATGEAADVFTARPVQPSAIIYGDAIQAAAFDLDIDTADKMAELAARRDKELTPPPPVHFDAKEEVRTRGTGFFAFSRDESERTRQMEALERQRMDTERVRAGRAENVRKRRQEVEERKKVVREKAGKARAEKFLDELGGDLLAEHDGQDDQTG